eukprot:m.35433 g.35433  ORF g.35433 m.35433 type:complete len:513 (-) comp17137_c0_seq2:102-1640(-)
MASLFLFSFVIILGTVSSFSKPPNLQNHNSRGDDGRSRQAKNHPTPSRWSSDDQSPLTPQSPSSSGQPVYNVIDFGARGDNSTECTAAFQAALLAALAGGGGKVYVPPGLFVLAGNLTIPPGVSLSGSYNAVPSHSMYTGQSLLDGSVLIPIGRRGSNGCPPGIDDLNCTEAFITIAGNAVVQGMTVYYAEQETTALPVAYPWTFRLGGIYDNQYSNNAALIDVELLGCWNGVAAIYAGRHYIARVQGQPLNIGIFVDEVYDIGRIEDVHFVPWFSQAPPLIYHQTTFGRAFVFARSDWEYVINTFAYAYAVGYHFIERASGGMNGNFVGIGADASTNASVLVEQSHPYGILIVNGEFTAFCDQGVASFDHPRHFCRPSDPSIAPVHLRVLEGNLGAVKFVDSSFWGPSHAIAGVDGVGTVSFIGCHFDDWDNQLNASATGFTHNGTAAFQQLGGTLIISTSEFKRIGTQMSLLSRAKKTVLMGNIIAGNLTIEKEIGYAGKLATDNNLDDS